MGLLQEGKWVDKWYDTKSSGGRYIRKESYFRSWVTADGTAGPEGEDGSVHLQAEVIEAFLKRHLSDEEDLAVPIILHHRLRG